MGFVIARGLGKTRLRKSGREGEGEKVNSLFSLALKNNFMEVRSAFSYDVIEFIHLFYLFKEKKMNEQTNKETC